MKEQYQKNLRTLKQRLPYIYDKIESEKDCFEVAVAPQEDFRNALISHDGRRCYANSLYDSKKEMHRYFENMDTHCKTVIILGIGSGYVLDYISRFHSGIERIILIEPSLELFKYALGTINLEKQLAKYDISIIVNFPISQAVGFAGQMVEERLNTGIHIVTQHSFASLFESYYREFSNALMKVLRRELSQVATTFNIPYKRTVNAMTNLSKKAHSAEELIPLLRNNTVFIVSAGPSLQKNMNLIEEAMTKGIVISVGTAIEILDQNDIKPHLRAAFSPYVDTTIFKILRDETVPLIYLDSLYHDILPAYKGELFKLVSTGDSLTKYVMNRMGIPYHELVTEVSIANVMIEFCLQIGVSEVVLIGQDMAYTDKKLYADGSTWNASVHENQEGLILEKGYNDEMLYTDIKFVGMRDAIARSILRNLKGDSLTVVNCTEGGLNIPMTRTERLSEHLHSLPEKSGLQAQLCDILGVEPELSDQEYKGKFIGIVEDIRSEILAIDEINEERVKMLAERIQERESGKSVERIIRKYEEMNAFENRLKEISLYNDVIQYEFHGIFRSVIIAFKYQGIDQIKQLEGAENMMVRICLEIRKIVNTFKMLIDEFYGIEYPDGIGSLESPWDALSESILGECSSEPSVSKEILN